MSRDPLGDPRRIEHGQPSIYACVMTYPTDRAKVERARPAHRRYLMRLLEEGRVVSAGSFVPEDDGGLFLYRARSLEEAQALVDEDPYLVEGVIRHYVLRRYEIHGANPDLLEVTRPGDPRPSA